MMPAWGTNKFYRLLCKNILKMFYRPLYYNMPEGVISDADYNCIKIPE